jgi:hypothetical protein
MGHFLSGQGPVVVRERREWEWFATPMVEMQSVSRTSFANLISYLIVMMSENRSLCVCRFVEKMKPEEKERAFRTYDGRVTIGRSLR